MFSVAILTLFKLQQSIQTNEKNMYLNSASVFSVAILLNESPFMKQLTIFFLFLTCATLSAQQLTKFVDPFLGTGGHGHVYPGAVVPFGMVQLSPDNGDEGWDWCSGYHYNSKTIAGFSHMHLSGTGIGDWCDISVLPLTDTSEIRKEKIKIPFSHANEFAKPGYYSVQLNNQVQAELTANERTGFHRYTFPNKTGWLRFDMGFRINWDQSTNGMLQLVDAYTLVGYRFSTGWAKGQKIYFAAKFSSPVLQHFFIDDTSVLKNKADGKLVKIALQFSTLQPVLVTVSLSTVSTNKALLEVNKTSTQNFKTIAANAETLWEKELQKIKINTNNKELATKFYTSLYRTCLAPLISSDADGAYQTHDNKQLKFTKGKNKYTVFSQWDVFRALNPLYHYTNRTIARYD